MFDPDQDGDVADASSLPFQIGQDPSTLPQRNGFDIERGELLPA